MMDPNSKKLRSVSFHASCKLLPNAPKYKFLNWAEERRALVWIEAQRKKPSFPALNWSLETTADSNLISWRLASRNCEESFLRTLRLESRWSRFEEAMGTISSSFEWMPHFQIWRSPYRANLSQRISELFHWLVLQRSHCCTSEMVLFFRDRRCKSLFSFTISHQDQLSLWFPRDYHIFGFYLQKYHEW